MNLQQWIQVLRKRWKPIFIATLVGVLLAVAYNLTASKMYTSEARLFVATTSQSNTSNAFSDAQFSSQRIATYVQLVNTRELLADASEELGYKVTKSSVTASSPLNTVIIIISATDKNPNKASDITNVVSRLLGERIQELETPVGDFTTTNVKASVVERAVPPTLPSSPRNKLDLAIGLLLGLAVGVSIALLIEALDNTIKTIDDVVTDSGMNPIGVIGFDPDGSENPICMLKPHSIRSEAYRAIRANVQFVDVDNPPRVIVVASAVPGEGKTTSTINLAIAFAQAGHKVALIEGDLRKPRLAKYLGIDGSIGLTNVLANQISLGDAFVSWNRGMLQVLASGPVPSNPSELLGSERMIQLVNHLRDEFDYVFIDGTPLLLVSDAAVVARISDGALLMTHFGDTTHSQLRRASEILRTVGARPLGPIVNFVPQDSSSYGYGYGYGYGDNDAVPVDFSNVHMQSNRDLKQENNE